MALFAAADLCAGDYHKWQVLPPKATLDGPESSLQLVVIAKDKAGMTADLTHVVKYTASDTNIIAVNQQGQVTARGEGKAVVQVRHKNQTTKVVIEVQGIRSPPPVSFRHDVMPILSKAGCNSSGCHGKAEGQNGFKLSVFGNDPQADYDALVKEARGRRIFFASPKHSLLLRKATGQTGHGGGRKIEQNSLWERRIQRWIAEGARFDGQHNHPVAKIIVEPANLLLAQNASQQLRVTAVDSAGQVRDVTSEAEFQSNFADVAGVEENGLIRVRDVPGSAAILVRYLGHVNVCRATVPRPDSAFQRPPENNFVDTLVWNQLARLGIAASPSAGDAVFLRRVYLDTIGTLPTANEARDFLADKSKDKRKRLVDELLQRDEYAQYSAMRWADVLRVDSVKIKAQGAVAMSRWLKRQFAKNTPYDQFARSVLTARGSVYAEGPASFFVAHKNPEEMGRSVSQVFLGVRIECAQCHHHPFGRWSQKDYFAFAGFFTGVGRKGNRILPNAGKDLPHPRTKEIVSAAGLGAGPANFTDVTDRRTVLAEWMTSPKNPFFARMIANKLWAHYFGRGLVEPVDDMRATNPAANEPLLDALAKHMVDLKYDLKAFTRTLLNSRVYQLSAETNESNKLDKQNFSHAIWKPMPAEVLLDAICQTTGVPEKFNGWPEGYRAIQVWDSRMPSYFFKIFGRPARNSVCACERGTEPSIAQALHLMNAPEVTRKIRHRDGLAAKLARSKRTPDEIIDEIYLTALARFPNVRERELMKSAFAEADRRTAAEDVLWTLLNTKEFVFNR